VIPAAKVQAQLGRASRINSVAQVLELYRGIVPPLLTTGAMRSLYFGTYEVVLPAVARFRQDAREDTLPTIFVAGAVTGLSTAPITAPVQRLKLVQQMTPLSMRETVQGLLVHEGVRGLFRGLGLHCALETIGCASPPRAPTKPLASRVRLISCMFMSSHLNPNSTQFIIEHSASLAQRVTRPAALVPRAAALTMRGCVRAAATASGSRVLPRRLRRCQAVDPRPHRRRWQRQRRWWWRWWRRVGACGPSRRACGVRDGGGLLRLALDLSA
jgi:hypothetical protein